MNNLEEMERWLKDGKASFEAADRNLKARDYRVAIQQAQLSIELLAKAVISYFEEPQWVHNPAEQLRSIVNIKREDIARKCTQEMVDSLLKVAEYTQEVAPWHGWSVYGKELEDGGWISAVELCDEETSNTLLSFARETIEIVDRLHGYFSSQSV